MFNCNEPLALQNNTHARHRAFWLVSLLSTGKNNIDITCT